MEKDTEKTDVIFRAWKHGDFKDNIDAYFVHECDCFDGRISCYTHIGQHSLANYQGWCVQRTRLATPEEYADLKAELESIGYNLNVIKKQNTSKYLKSYNNLLKNLLKNK